MSFRRWSGVVGGLALVVLAGCGAGDRGLVGDYFNGAGGPGSVFSQPATGSLTGLVLLRPDAINPAVKHVLVVALGDLMAGDAPIAGARVTLGGTSQTGLSDATGRYLVTGVPGGLYDVTFTMPASVGGPAAVFQVRVTAGQTLQGVPTP